MTNTDSLANNNDGSTSESISKMTLTSSTESRYKMMGSVGKGAMGEILLAKEHGLFRKVAYKKIHKQMALNQTVLMRFLDEAQITAQLDHPNIVPIYTLEASPDGEIAYSMKLIQGRDFKELLTIAKKQYKEYGVPEEDYQLSVLLDHFLKVCDAMHYAHMKGVIHRDLKPANIMIGPYNEVYVMDWGIARVMGKAEELIDSTVVEMIYTDSDESEFERTQLGQILGTPRYMSPQQAAGKNDDLDGRSDLFALGLILFEIVTLKPAFTAKTSMELLKKVLKVQLEPFKHFSSKVKVPVELEAIILKATARKVDGRYASVEEFADDIRRYLRGEAVMARPDTPIQKVLRWIGRHQNITIMGIMSILLLTSISSITSLYYRQMTILESQQKEQALSHFLTSVAQQSQLINNQLVGFEISLSGLASVSQQALLHDKNGKMPFYWNDDYSNPDKRPDDLSYSSHYGKLISLNWPVFKLAPGVTKDSVLEKVENLSTIQPYFRRLFLTNINKGFSNQAFQDSRKELLSQGTPFIWAYIGLKEGLHLAYPGKTGYPPAYDPRERPWYKLAANKHGLHWGNPYVDVQGQGLVLPCTTAIYDYSHRFLGVVGIELTFHYIVDNLMTLPASDNHDIQGTYLIDSQGQIMVSSGDKNKKYGLRFGEDTLHQTMDTALFEQGDVVEAIQAKKSGYIQYKRDGRELLVAFYPLETLGWYYVVTIDYDRLLKAS